MKIIFKTNVINLSRVPRGKKSRDIVPLSVVGQTECSDRRRAVEMYAWNSALYDSSLSLREEMLLLREC